MYKIILFNKPYGVVSQFTGDIGEQTLAQYIREPGFYAAGRLDKNSEGLLLLTNNGQLQHRLTDPRYHKQKYYWVEIEGIPVEADLDIIRRGLQRNNVTYLPATIRLIDPPQIWARTPPIRVRQSIPTCWLEIILQEGKNHQIRKMTAAIGFPTLRLIRHRIADWSLNELLPGQYTISRHI
jgi:23S rRNA pseudouridine2457 synthase